ncbi:MULTISPECIES: hypothetical protein [Rhodanobacter]|nr:hypothetical protein [Rhodanobacter thiooxydans]UJJ55089.1 hypothetical protein LRK53_01395 [Rhodanobacter thiooxydans]
MSGPLGFALAGLAMLVGASNVWAASGRVVFSGAVVEPTCVVAEAGSIAQEAGSPAAQHLACGRTATDAGRSYTREVIDLTAANRGHDRLLDYFVSYARRNADGAAAAKLVVHTYD